MPSRVRLSLIAVLFAVCVTVAGCSGTTSKPAAATSTSAVAAGASRDEWGTTWLCRPGLAGDPCTSPLTATVVPRLGATHVERGRSASKPAIDCFYVYPTISGQWTVNANLAIGFREREVAVAQASRFSQVCRVFAPVYRQITLSALDHPARIRVADALIAYDSVRSAFRDYLTHYNHGRGMVFIGHSQGAAILIRLLKQEVDGTPPVRRRLVSAILLGGNVTVRKGRTVGGDFAHIPACESGRQTGCVVAYSSFSAKPPQNSQFGRTTSDAGVRLLAPHKRSPNIRILCVNPSSLAGGTFALDPYVPSLILGFLRAGSAPAVRTPWVSFPGEYRATCESSGNATWLQVSRIAGAADGRPSLARLQDPALGLHVLDVNIALGNLVQLVRDEAAAYAAPPPCRLSQFDVSVGPYVSEATGQHTLALRLANRGSQTCAFDGYPRVTVYDAAGVIPFVITHHDQMISSRLPKPVVVRPSGRAFVVINKYRCDSGAVPGTRTRRITISAATRAVGSASITFGDLHTIPMPYRVPDYCGKGDPGSTLAVSPFVGTVRAALGG
jgi:uncharacterized protein YceK